MEGIISKEEFNKLMKIEGEVRGDGMKNYAEYILKEKGEKGLKKLEETITNLGYPIKYREIRAMDFYPVGLEIVTLVTIKRLFNFDDEKFQEMGRLGAKSSFVLRVFMKFLLLFVSPEKLIQEVPRIWKKAGAIGDLKVADYDLEKKRLVLRLENFQVHPLYCEIFKGYFLSGLQMIIKDKGTCEETKCFFRGQDYHEFLLKW